MTDRGLAAVIQAMAGAQKLLVPMWLYEAIKANVDEEISEGYRSAKVTGLHYPGGELPLSVGEFLPDDLMVILERNGGMKGVKLERESMEQVVNRANKEAASVSSTFHPTRTRE